MGLFTTSPGRDIGHSTEFFESQKTGGDEFRRYKAHFGLNGTINI